MIADSHGDENITAELARGRFLAKRLPRITPSDPRRLLSLQQVPLLGDDQNGAELVRANLIKADVNPEFQRAHQIERAPDEQSLLGALGGVQAVQRAVVAPLIIVRRVGAEARIAQFLPAQCPMHQKPERRIIRPLPG